MLGGEEKGEIGGERMNGPSVSGECIVIVLFNNAIQRCPERKSDKRGTLQLNPFFFFFILYFLGGCVQGEVAELGGDVMSLRLFHPNT